MNRTKPAPVMVGAIPWQPRRFRGVLGWQVSPASFPSRRQLLEQESTPAGGWDPVQRGEFGAVARWGGGTVAGAVDLATGPWGWEGLGTPASEHLEEEPWLPLSLGPQDSGG